MAWTAPPTFVSGNVLTAAQLNILAADLNETAPAKATGVGQYFVATAANAIVARTPVAVSVTTSETTTSAAFADLATLGPQADVTSGVWALVCVESLVSNGTAGATSSIGIDISGATTIAASTIWLSNTSGTAGQGFTAAGVRLITGLTAGLNTFTMKYVVSSGTTGTFSRRHLAVVPF